MPEKFWACQSIQWVNPATMPRYFPIPANHFKNYLDPTARHMPFHAPNREGGLFRTLEKFGFADGRTFDFRGDPDQTTSGRGTLGNSKRRAPKGFAPTFQRDFGGLAGRYKLDWFIIKPCITNPRDPSGSYWLAPRDGRTLRRLNEAIPGRISDHHPITVDLPLAQPGEAGLPCQ